MRILGIDYGDSRIGLSVSDELGIIAQPLETYNSKSMRKDVDYIAELVQKVGAGKIVLGLPLMTDGTEGERALKTRAFGRTLNKVTQLEVIYKDERFSTVTALSILKEGGAGFKKTHEMVDSLSARIILQGFLDSVNYKGDKL